MSQVASDTYNLSLQGLLLGFMKFAFDRKKTSFPPFESKLWHDFLFLLKFDFENKFPELKCIGAFDWNDIRPKCRELGIAMFAIRYKCYGRVPDGRIFLNPEIKWGTENLFEKYYTELAEQMLLLAHQIPRFFEPR